MLAFIIARRRRRERARQKALFLMRVLACEFSALVLKTMALKLHRQDTKVRHYFTRADLPPPEMSAWAHVVRANTDNGYLEMTSLTVGAFRKLHDVFGPRMLERWQRNRVHKNGRKRIASTWDCLGLVLSYMHSTETEAQLGQKFGYPPPTCCRYLKEGREVLLETLREMPEAAIKWPSPSRMEYLAQRVHAAQPALPGCFGFVDGLNIPISDPADPVEQNAYYNAWLAGCFCSNIFVFDSEGCIIWCCINAPGSWHDSAISMKLYTLLRTKVPEGKGICADSAFAASGDLATKIFKPLTEKQIAAAAHNEGIHWKTLINFLKKHRAAVSVRQAAEWGMGSIQRTYRRLYTTLTCDHAERKRDLSIIVRLFNYRTRTTHINQIRTVYDPSYLGRDPDSVFRWSMFHDRRNPTF